MKILLSIILQKIYYRNIEEIDFTEEEEIYIIFEYVKIVESRDYIEVNNIDYYIQEYTLLVYGNLTITNKIDIYYNDINREASDIGIYNEAWLN